MNMKASRVLLYFIVATCAVVFFFPIYILLMNSFKTYIEIFETPLRIIGNYSLKNYFDAWEITHYPRHFLNSLFVTVLSVLTIIITSSMAAYKLARTKTKLSGILFALFVSSIMVPFHVIMIPLARIIKTFNMTNSLLSVVFIGATSGISMSIFLYHGFVKGIPIAMEEAARIDGCGELQLFSQVVFPMLTPITFTVAIINALHSWNSFLLPLIILSNKGKHTLPLLAYQFITQFNREWDKQLAAVVLVAAPVVIFYLFMQKYIIAGIAEGAVKG